MLNCLRLIWIDLQRYVIDLFIDKRELSSYNGNNDRYDFNCDVNNT